MADSPRLRGAQERIATQQAEVDAASAELTQIRQRIADATSEERPALEAEEAQIQARKDRAIARLDELTAQAQRIARDARETSESAPTEPVESPTGIVLAPDAMAPPAPTPIPVATPGATPAVAVAVTGGPDAAAIDAYLASKGSPLTGLGAVFVAEAQATGLDPRFLVAIAGAETSFGSYGPSQSINNPFGLGPGMAFSTWGEAIHYAATNLAGPLYRGAGHVTIAAINNVWAPIGAGNDPTNLNSNWSRNVGMYYAEQGGDPNAAVFVGVPTPAAAAGPTPFAPTAAFGTVGVAGPDAAAAALELLGTPHPAEQPSGGLDATGLIATAYSAQGVAVPRRLPPLSVAGVAVNPLDMRAGDVVLFGDPSGTVVHAGMYLGDGQFVHAPGPDDVVRLGSLYEQPWVSAYAGARRL